MTTKSAMLSQLIRTAEAISLESRYEQMEFWGRELRRTWGFLMDHEEYYIAYLQKKVQSEDKEGAGTNKCPLREGDSEMLELISVGIGYFAYAQSRIDQFRSRWQNRCFLRA